MPNDSNTKNSLFVAGDRAPGPVEVATLLIPIPRSDGRMALTEITGHSDIPDSFVELEDLVDGPKLKIHKGIGRLVIGHTDPDTGIFSINDDQEVGHVQISGTYTGPGSLLRIYQLVKQAKRS